MKKILFVVTAMLAGIACSSATDVNNAGTEKQLLVKFAVTIGNNNYNAVIDHYAGTVKIGAIKNLDEIDGVDYLLADNATIDPLPESFVGNWAKEQTVVVAANGMENTYNVIFTRYRDPSEYEDPEEDYSDFDYDYRPDFLPKDDEKQIYEHPGAVFTKATMPVGAPHPNKTLAAAGWKLFTVNEFTDGRWAARADGKAVKQPYGLYPFDTAMMNESAKVDNENSARIENGRLIMEASRLPEVIKTGFTNQYNATGEVQYRHAAFRTYPSRNAQMGDWFTLAPNMRMEVRYRRTNTVGFNNAIWFQGNVQNVPWPDYGEIDLFENPKKTINQTMHSTLHSANFSSNNGNAPTQTIDLDDMTRWNIYWIELYPDKVVMGVNGRTLFQQVKGEGGYTDWPWDHEDGFYMIFSTGMHDADHSTRNGWMGDVRPIDFEDPNNLPSMEFDWVRVYVNGAYDREEAMGVYY